MCPPLLLRPNGRFAPAFTLIELLVVIGVMALVMTMAVPAFIALQGGRDFTSEVYDIAGTLELARAYAMANNTYALAGITEVLASQSSSASPQQSGTGRITIAVIASKTGTRPYDATNPTNVGNNWKLTYYNTGAITLSVAGAVNGGFISNQKLMQFENIHLVDLQSANSQPPASGNMARPAVLAAYDVPNANCASTTLFAWPLGTKLLGSPSFQYKFSKIIEFDPQGAARIISNVNLASIPKYIEIGLEPAHGVVAAGAPSDQNHGQQAAIQIDGMSGSVSIYRP